MSDITDRLRRWTHDANAQPASDLMDDAADMIDSLRREVTRLSGEIEEFQNRLDTVLPSE